MKFCIQLSLVLVLLISFSFRAHAQPILTIDTIIDATCNASADGAINISVAGTPNFTYAWSNGATTEDVSGLFSGPYVVTVTDGLSGVTVSSVLTVNAPPVLTVNTDTVIHVSCAGDTNGAVFITVGGGVPNYTYIWDNGATTEDVSGLAEGPVNLTVTDANGCTSSSKSIFLDSIAPINLVVDTISNISCNAANDGYINITVTGGVGNFSYLWNSGQTTDDISALAASLYTVTATDSNGCSVTSGPHTIIQPGVLNISLDTIIHVLCNGENTGQVLITTSGGTTPYSFSWSNGATTEDITGLLGDTYFVTVTDTIGCLATSGPHVVNEPSTMVVTVDSIIHQLCSSVPSGAVDLSVSGGTPGYTYLWGNGETTQDVTGLYSGVNDVTVTDNNGCTASAKSIFLDSIAPIVITLDSVIEVSCNGANDGAVFVSVSGGTGPAYFYNWSNGATTQNITGLSGNSYSVTVTDSNSCVMVSGPHLVAEPSTLVLTFDSLHHVDCNGNANGAVFVTTAGGTTSYSYNWSNGMTTEDITGLDGGSFSLTVTDANGCVDSTGPHVVNEPAALILTLDSIHHVDCNGNGNGAVFITASGGTTNYTYNWSNGMTTEDITGLNGGNFTLTVTDANGCTVTDTAFVVIEPVALSIVLDSIVHVSCNGFGDGAVFVSPSGGTTNYSFVWSNGFTTEDVTGLSGGSFTLTLTDANGCTITSGPHVVNEPAGMTITLDTIGHVSCNAASDGLIRITASGGAPVYTFLWSNGMTADDISGLPGGPYDVTVTDNNGCTVSAGPFVVNEPAVLQLTLDSIQHVDCNGNGNGAVFITASGGTINYTYNWSNGMTTEDISGLNGGNYTLTVSDANGCTVTDTAFVVNEPAVLAIALDSIVHVSCNGFGDGSVFISPSGGTTGYSFVWSNGFTTQNITGLGGGSYSLTLTDTNGCTATSGPHVVNEPAAMAVSLDTIIHVSCNAASNGEIRIVLSGGSPNYSFLWSNGMTADDISGLPGGPYDVTVTDNNGCTVSAGPFVVEEDSLIVISLDTIINVSCNAAADGSVQISVGGGVPNYSFVWDNGMTTEDISGLSGGDFNVTVTDSAGCIMTSGIHTVNEPVPMVVTFDSLEHVDCNGNANGAVFITTSGGTTNYGFVWSNGMTTEDISGLSGASYTLTVTDANGCVDSTGPHVINEPAALTITLDSIINVTCNGNANGAVFLTVAGGSTAYAFAWDNADTTEDISGLSGGNYNLTVTDANGCTLTHGPDSVSEPDVLQIVVDTFKNESCDGINDGFINTSVLGGTAPFGYVWNTSATTNNITGLIAGTYTLTLTDSNSCVAIDSITINDIPTITVTLDALDSVSCNGLSDGAVNITTTLGAPDYTWLWSNADTTETLSGLDTGFYSVTVTDSLGCQVTAGPFLVEQPDVLVLTLGNVDSVSCNGANDGAVTLSTSGGTATYFYNWSNGSTTEDISALNGNSYSLTVTDINACSATSGPHVVNEETAIAISLDTIIDLSCNAANDGTVAVTASGGVPSYLYNWDNSSATTSTISGLAGNTYTLTITDAAGCTATSGPHTVTEPAALSLSITPTVPLQGCLGQAIGVLDASASGGTASLSYLWSNAATSASNTGLNTGVYTVTVTDANGCTITAQDSIQDPLVPTVSPFVGQSPITDTTINWNDVILVDAGNDQSSSGVNYQWSETTSLGDVNFDDATSASTTVNPQPVSPGTYVLLLTATSADGCIDTGSVTITITISELIGMPNAFTPNGDAINDYFRPAGLDDQFILEFKIYNRWSQLVFDGTDTSINWDGTYHGVEQPSEVYIYILRYKTPGQEEKIMKGETTLMR